MMKKWCGCGLLDRRWHDGAKSLGWSFTGVGGRMGLAIGGLSCLVLPMVSAQPAIAGGIERGGYSIDRLFDPQALVASSSASYVMPHRKLDNVKDTNPRNGTSGGKTSGVAETESYFTPYASVKIGLGDHVDCLFDYSQPWGAHSRPGDNWAGSNSNIETKITSDNYAATCSLRFDAGQGQVRFIGGGFYQEIDGFKVRRLVPAQWVQASGKNGTGRTELSSDGVGWRLGVAYEIPKIALRASMVYTSAVSHDVSGKVDLSQITGQIDPALGGKVVPVFGKTKVPQVLELKMQSGVAPDWLAFGSIKWVDWSVLQSVPFCTGSGSCAATDPYPKKVTSLDMLFRDGYTVTGGIGHKINDKVDIGASFTYDRGTQKGFGDQTDTYSLGAFVDYKPYENCTLFLGGVVGVLTSGHSAAKVGPDGETYGTQASYDFGNDLVAAPYASMKVSF